ncbi:hypothetical protein K3495_g5061 [Podosphaera aphanis]|nr:hypothetical protein K3495_g5061 [Podosphaera aphanis]
MDEQHPYLHTNDTLIESDIFEVIVNRYSIIDGDSDGDGDDNDCDDEFEEIRPSISEASKASDTLQSFIFLGKDGGKISVFKALNQIGNEISQERRNRFTQSSIDNWLVRSQVKGFLRYDFGWV